MFLGSNDLMLKTIDLPMRVEKIGQIWNFSWKNRFKGKSIETKVENQSRASRRGNTNSTSLCIETKFEDQSRVCKGASRFVKTKSENQSKACKGVNRSTKTKSEYQSRKMFKDIYHWLDLQPDIQKILKLSVDSIICSLKF
jgi:hypothetical protein